MEKPLIRGMTENDIIYVAEIERMSFSTPWSEILFFNELYKQRSFAKVAVTEEALNAQRVVGYICASYVADEGHILDLAIHPDFRRKGLAKTLVTDILKDFKETGCRFIYLEVRASNFAAQKLYEGFGFKVFGTRKDYYGEPKEDAVVMSLRLDSGTLKI